MKIERGVDDESTGKLYCVLDTVTFIKHFLVFAEFPIRQSL